MGKYRLLYFILCCLSITTSYSQQVPKLEWAKTTRGGPSSPDRANVRGAQLDPSGNVVIWGRFNFTPDFDPGPGVAELTANGDNDGFILRLDKNGNFVSVGAIGKAGPGEVNGMAVDAAGNTIIVGYFVQTMDFDPGPGVFEQTATANAQGFVVKVTAAGTIAWFTQLGSGGIENLFYVDTDAAGNVYITGTQNGTNSDFDPGPGFSFLAANGNFVWKPTLMAASAGCETFQMPKGSQSTMQAMLS